MAAVGMPPPAANGSATPASGLGRFADYVVPVVVLVVLMAAIAAHLHLGGAEPDTFLDAIALVAIGQVFGRAQGVQVGATAAQAAALDAVNSNTRELVKRADLNTALAAAAHERLDKLGAPAAPLDHTGVQVGGSNG